MTTAAATASAPDAGADPAPASSQPRPAPRVVPHRRASRTRPPRRAPNASASSGIPAFALAATSGLLGVILGYVLGSHDARAASPRAPDPTATPPPSSEPTGTAARKRRAGRAPSSSGAAAPERTMMMSAVVASPMRLGENATGAPAPRRRGSPAALTPAKVRAVASAAKQAAQHAARRRTAAMDDDKENAGDAANEEREEKTLLGGDPDDVDPNAFAPPGSETGWSAADFREWCRLKMGAKDPSSGAEEDPSSSEDPSSAPSVVPCARWIVSGELYEYPAGRLLARVEGVDLARCVVERADAVAHQLSRKMFVFLHPDTLEPLPHVEPVKYPYQHVVYRRERVEEKDESESSVVVASEDARGASGAKTAKTTNKTGTPRHRVVAEVTTGVGADVARCEGNSVRARRTTPGAAAADAFSCPVFMDVVTADGDALEAYENYEYFSADETKNDASTCGGNNRRETFGSAASGDRCAWTRFGATAPFGDRCVLRAVAWRADEGGDDALPAGIRAALAKEARGWRDAPRDLEEIRAMQAGEVGVWA